MRGVLMAGAAGSAMLLAAVPAWAQVDPARRPISTAARAGASTPEATTVQDVVVTASKRSQRLFNVPNAVTAISGQSVDTLRLQDTRELLSLVPTAFLQENNAGTARDINIRGVGTPTLFAESGVALYIDNVYSSGFISYPTQFYDLERVEVLRGPQGGLYGRNAVGGAVNIISHQPTDHYEAYGRASYGSFDRYELEGMANAPLGDKAAVRILAWRTEQDSGEYYNQTTGQYIDASDTRGVRATFRAKPIESLTFNLVAEFSDANTAGTNLYFPDSGETKDTIRRDTQPTNFYTTTRVAGELNWTTPVGQFNLVVGNRNYALSGAEDTDLSDVASAQQVLTRKNSVHSDYLEGKWISPDYGPVSLLAGASYLHDRAAGSIFDRLVGTSARIGAPAIIAIDNQQAVESWAAFIEGTWRLTPTLSLIGDLRYTNDEKSENFAFSPSPALTAVVPSFKPQALITTKPFTNVSPGVTLAWSPAVDWRAYAKIQTGFRAGGFNFNVGSVADLPYNEETSINYEIGVKHQLPHRGFLGVTAFLLRQDDVLVPEYDFASPGPVASFLANAGRARTYGLELEGGLQIMPGLDLNANLGYLNAEFTSGTATFGGALKGKELPSARNLTGTITTNYRRPLTGDIDFIASAIYSHRNQGWADVANTSRVDAVDLFNLRLGVDMRHRFQITGYVQNLLDNDYLVAGGGFRPPNSFGVYRAPGRSFGVEVRAAF